MVYYRKYRPQTFDQLDKREVRESLSIIFSKPEIPHAFLFTGPKGTGKTSAGRIIGKQLNCEKTKGFYQTHNTKHTTNKLPMICNICPSCKAITAGVDVDVLEIDAASNTGVDNIREIRDAVTLSPLMGGKKVYIIDEVHMLSKGAFNALLKTLEEPPDSVVFVLATTELEKLPGTVRSRCTQILFSKATDEELLHSFKRIIDGEKLKLSDEVLLLIAQKSEGSFRDGAKLLEQLVTEGRTDIESVKKFLHITGTSEEILLTQIMKNDVEGALLFIEEKEKSGADFIKLIESILVLIHKKIISYYSDSANKESSKAEILRLSRLSRMLTIAYRDTKYVPIPSLPLEVTIIEFCIQKEV